MRSSSCTGARWWSAARTSSCGPPAGITRAWYAPSCPGGEPMAPAALSAPPGPRRPMRDPSPQGDAQARELGAALAALGRALGIDLRTPDRRGGAGAADDPLE